MIQKTRGSNFDRIVRKKLHNYYIAIATTTTTTTLLKFYLWE